MSAQTNQCRHSRFLSTCQWLKKLLVVSAVVFAGIVGTTNDLRELFDGFFPDIFSPQIKLSFDHTDPVAVGTKLTLYYELPDHGYFSLWNKNGNGHIKRFYPQQGHMIKLNEQNRVGRRFLVPKDPNTVEEVIVLWVKEVLPNPPERHYLSVKQFEKYVEANSSFDIQQDQVAIQVL